MIFLSLSGLFATSKHAGSPSPAWVLVYCGNGWDGEAGWAGWEGLDWLPIPEYWATGKRSRGPHCGHQTFCRFHTLLCLVTGVSSAHGFTSSPMKSKQCHSGFHFSQLFNLNKSVWERNILIKCFLIATLSQNWLGSSRIDCSSRYSLVSETETNTSQFIIVFISNKGPLNVLCCQSCWALCAVNKRCALTLRVSGFLIICFSFSLMIIDSDI